MFDAIGRPSTRNEARKTALFVYGSWGISGLCSAAEGLLRHGAYGKGLFAISCAIFILSLFRFVSALKGALPSRQNFWLQSMILISLMGAFRLIALLRQ